MTGHTRLGPEMVDRVLEGLGSNESPAVDLAGLSSLYGQWCRRVPFDNVRKRIAIVEGHGGPLPGDAPGDFFRGWLEHGTGGTCWAGNGALQALLVAVGFDARLGVGTMLPEPGADVPPNHGTVIVHLGERRFLVDASMLHQEPLELVTGMDTRVEHPAWGVRALWSHDRLHLRWHPLRVEEMDCRIESLHSSREEFGRRHEAARTRSGFNFQLSARLLRDDRVVGAVRGERVERDAQGRQQTSRLQGAERIEFMTRVLGMSEEIAFRLPPDEPLPPGL